MQKHHGQIIENLVRKKSYSITELARNSDVSRSVVYQWFTKKDLNAEIIHRVGKILNHDFSNEFPEYFDKGKDNVYHLPNSRLAQNHNIDIWKDKYISLLEKYVELLKE